MESLIIALIVILGLTIGSFLNVVIYRVPLGLSLIKPRSKCPGCDKEIVAYDNIPLVSWMLLRGKCRKCGIKISIRYPLVEVATSALFLWSYWFVGLQWVLIPLLVLAVLTISLSLIDLETHKLPNSIVRPALVLVPLIFGVGAALGGAWSQLGRAMLGGFILWAVYFLLFIAKPAGIGFGDVKLAWVLGIFLGWWGWGALIVGGFAAFLIGGCIGLIVILAKRGGRKTAIPFGPSMFLGTYLGLAWGSQLWSEYLRLVGL